MSSFKNFAPMLTSLQAQADGTGTLDGSAIEDFLSIAGYETPGGGGGGSSDLTIANVTITCESGFTSADLFVVYVYEDLLNSEFILTQEGDYDLGIVLYKGFTSAALTDGNGDPYDKTKVSVTGDVVIAEEGGDWWFDITGDGTITLSAGGGGV